MNNNELLSLLKRCKGYIEAFQSQVSASLSTSFLKDLSLATCKNDLAGIDQAIAESEK